VALDHASDGNYCLAAARRLVSGRLDHRIDRLFLRRVDEATGVDDDDLRLGEIRGVFGREIRQVCEISLAVDSVLVAAKRNNADFHLAVFAAREASVIALTGSCRI